MVEPLVPCPSCDRHVRESDGNCPFCKTTLPEGLASRAVPAATQRLSRAAAFVFGATVAVTGCGADVIETGGAGGGGGAASSSDSTSATTSGSTSGAGGDSADAGPDDDGGTMALYGDPVPTDAGPDDDGGGEPIYGAAPFPDAGTPP